MLNAAMTDHAHLIGTHPNLKVFAPFLDDLNRESERGAVLISVSYLERQLKEIVSAFLCEGEASKRLLEGFNASTGHARGMRSRGRRSRPHISTRVPGAEDDQEDTQPVRPRSSHTLLGSGYRRSLPEPCLLSEELRRCGSGVGGDEEPRIFGERDFVRMGGLVRGGLVSVNYFFRRRQLELPVVRVRSAGPKILNILVVVEPVGMWGTGTAQ